MIKTTDATDKAYVRGGTGTYLVQLPDDNQWGFSLHDDDRTFPGGIGAFGGGTWEVVAKADVPAEVRARLDWLFDAE